MMLRCVVVIATSIGYSKVLAGSDGVSNLNGGVTMYHAMAEVGHVAS